MITKRQLLKVGGASILISGAGLGYFSATRTPEKALAPWSDEAHNYDDVRLRALSYAILAPNPHNRQPWLADLIGDDEVCLYCDLERRLPATDPYDRQITIGLGCFIELFEMAANQFGYAVAMQGFPEGEPFPRLDGSPVATLKLIADASVKKNPQFRFAKQRRSNKEEYDTGRGINDRVLGLLTENETPTVRVDGTNAGADIAVLRDLTWRALEVETYTPRTLQESIDLMRIGKTEINANPDGIDLGGIGLEFFAKLGLLDRTQMADQNSTAFKQGLDMYRALMFSAMGYAWVITPDNSRHAQLEAGRAWLRLNLKATHLSLGVHPISQALQEYPEMESLYAELHEMLDVRAPGRIQMLGRIGYGPRTAPSPRWRVENCLIDKA